MNAGDRAAARTHSEAATPPPWELRPWTAPSIYNDIVAHDQQLADMVEGADAEFIAHARADLPAALDAIDRVLALHQECDIGDGVKFCSYDHGDATPETWPCDILLAIEGAP